MGYKLRAHKALGNPIRTMAFVCITELPKGTPQTRYNVEYLQSALTSLASLGIEEVIVTTAQDCPIIIGSKSAGIAVAPIIIGDDEAEAEELEHDWRGKTEA